MIPWTWQFFISLVVPLIFVTGGLAQTPYALATNGPPTGLVPGFSSSEQRVSVIELFTSEGCSSCPPAEAWFSALQREPRLWREFVPVAFHVDYWDSLGWPDRWAKSSYSERQQNYAAAWGSQSVYTPGVVLNGHEWRGWARDAIPVASSAVAPGILRASRVTTNHWSVVFSPHAGGHDKYEASFAILACGLKSDVKAGENRGRKLIHDFVTVSLRTVPLLEKNGELSADFRVAEPALPADSRLAAAVWVMRLGETEPVQATGGWLSP
jgi:hypothetical protein